MNRYQDVELDIEPVEQDGKLFELDEDQHDDAELQVEPEDAGQPEPPMDGRARRARQQQPRSRLASLFGIACLIGGIVLNTLQAQGKVPADLVTYGLQPATLFVAGAIALGATMVRRQLSLANQRIEDIATLQQQEHDQMRDNLHWFFDRHHQGADRPPLEGEELQHILVVLQRQDEKINNLTKALKMYGKPLMEIASQGADTAGLVSQISSSSDTLLATLRQSTTRLESLLANTGGSDVAAVRDQLGQLAAELQQGLGHLGDRLPNADGLQQQLLRVEAQVQAVSQRLEDSEMRKSLLRLEDGSRVQAKKLEELARTEALQAATDKLERQLYNSVGKVGATVEQMRDSNLGSIESVVRDLQREIAGLATSLAQIQQLVRQGPARATAMATPFAVPPPAPPVTTVERAPAPPPVVQVAASRAEPAAPSDTSGMNDAQAGAAQNRTGARSSSSKNVLGAIAKLKQMKH